jgi:hypothetical protein
MTASWKTGQLEAARAHYHDSQCCSHCNRHTRMSQERQRAETAVYCPGYAADIRGELEKCHTCHKIAPTLPMTLAFDLLTHYVHVCIDCMHGANYGVVVVRYTGCVKITVCQ